MNVPPIASRYRILRELGRGGMGVVYVVEHVHTGDHVALKVLLGDTAKNPQAVDRFKREARASARIKSEHVVRIIDADVAPELNGAPFLVMELLNGADLQKRIEQGGRLSPAETIQYLTQAASALDKSHAAGIVHRDLKPENLFLHTREDGSVILKILDFGISKFVTGDAGNDIASAGATKTGAIMGTPLYMSPEQARGRIAEIGPATDVWAMGLIGLQLLTGEIYWRANTVAELMSQILSEPFYPTFERWTWLPPEVDAWFQRSCARDPRARFQTVGEQIAGLASAVGVAAPASTGLPGYALAPAAVSAGTLPGARTTTGATAQAAATDGGGRSRGWAGAAGAVVALAVAVVAAFFARSQMSGGTPATPAMASTPVPLETSATVPAASPPTAFPSVSPSAALPAPSASPPAASATAAARPPVHAASHTHAVAAPVPSPATKPTATVFSPSTL